MLKLLRFMKQYKKECIFAPFFKLLEATFELLVPLIVASIVDVGIKTGDKGYIVKMCLLLVTFGAIGLISTLLAQFYAAKAAVGFSCKVRRGLFAHIQSLSYTEIDALGTSSLITRMTSDLNQVQQGVNLTLRLFMRSPFIVFGAMIMAFTVDPNSAMIFVVTIPVLSVIVFGIMLICIPIYKRVQSRLDNVLSKTRSNLTGARVIRAFCKEESEKADFFARNNELTSVQKFVGKISSLMNPLTYVVINLAVIFLVWRGAMRVDTGVITQGAVIALYNYMSQILIELIKLANLIINITKSVACANRIQSVFEIENSVKSADTALSPDNANTVEFKGVSLCYKNAAENSVENISFTASAGDTIGIIGGTGSGKTSIINLIPRFYDATDGIIAVGGKDVKEWNTEALREKIGVVPQKAVLFKGTVRENMRWGKNDATDAEIYAALEIAQAKDFIDAKEGGLDYVIEQGGRNLSGGQKQRLTIARALVKRPDILILDDSASALDFATDAALRKAIKGMSGTTIVFIVSQRASSVLHADKIIVLDDGVAVGIGTHDDLIENCEVYKEIYYSQFERKGEKS